MNLQSPNEPGIGLDQKVERMANRLCCGWGSLNRQRFYRLNRSWLVAWLRAHYIAEMQTQAAAVSAFSDEPGEADELAWGG